MSAEEYLDYRNKEVGVITKGVACSFASSGRQDSLVLEGRLESETENHITLSNIRTNHDAIPHIDSPFGTIRKREIIAVYFIKEQPM